MILRYFPDTHMGLSHHGLTEIARKHKINLPELPHGNFVIFTNKKLTAVKVFAAGNTIAYKRTGTKLDLNMIKNIPRSFRGGQFNFDEALRETLEQKLGKAKK